MDEIKRNKTSTNFIFYVGYQILIYLIPFIISPFLTRTLKEDSLGIFTFSNTIAVYFVLLANLGIAKYGQRAISDKRNDQRSTFWSLFFDHLIFSFISILVFLILLFTVFKTQVNVYSICILYILSALFDVSWLFYGRENFKIVTIINGFFSIAKMILIFALIRNESHLFIYQILYYGAFLLSNITIFLIALRYVGKPTVDVKLMLKHIKPLLFFSLTVISITLYTIFNKTLIGLFFDKSEVAFYEYADKIIGIPKMLLLTIGTVLFPKMCALQCEDEQEKIFAIHKVSLFFSIGIGIGAIFGLVAIGKPLIILYYGENFARSGDYVIYMAPLVLFITLGDIFRTQFIIPRKNDKFYLLSVLLNAVVNLAISFALIKPLGVLGVIIGSVTAEAVGCIVQMIYCRKSTNFKKIGMYLLVFSICGAIMFGGVKLLAHFLPITGYLNIVILFVFALAVYGTLFFGFLVIERKRHWA